MKVVINRKFGGFGLSPEAEKAYAKRKGFEVFFYKQTQYSFSNDGANEYLLIECPDNDLFIYTLKCNLGDAINQLPTSDDDWFVSRDIQRNDPDLVTVVEELGDAANGLCAKLEIVDIPEGVEYEISEYDGMEHVAEQHRTWR